MKLYFVRHGESEANVLRIISNRDLPHYLTDNGRDQAIALAGKLRNRPISRVFASPIPRARQTGEILSTSLDVPLELAPALREPDCGVLEGRGDPDAWLEHKYWLETWLAGYEHHRGPKCGDTFAVARERFVSFVEKLVKEYGESAEELILVTHGEMIILGLPGLILDLDKQYIQEKGLGYAGLICAGIKDGKLKLIR
jgi:broad specificity phosphatase PhoE